MKKSFLTFILLIIVSVCKAQVPYNFRHIDINRGLQDNSISSLFVDSYGLLWIGTEAGLYRYDGYDVTAFDSFVERGKEHLLATIYNIREDKNGDLVMQTHDWKMKYLRHKHQIVSEGRIIEKFYTDAKGSKWRIDFRGLDTKSFYKNKLDIPENLFNHNDPIGIFVDSHKNIWLYSMVNNNVVCSSDRKNWKLFPSINTSIKAISEDKNGNLWIATDHKGLFRYRLSDGNIINIKRTEGYSSEINSNNITSILADNQGSLWLGHYKHGISYWNPIFNNFRLCAKECNDVSTIFVDHEGKTWLGTNGHGLFVEQQNGILKKIPIHELTISSITEDYHHRIWVGTYTNGLYCISDAGIKKYDKSAGNLLANQIWRMCIDPYGTLWIGAAWSPLMRFNTNTGKCSQLKDNRGKTVFGNAVFKNRQGNILIGTSEGLLIVNPKNLHQQLFSGNRKGNQKFLFPSIFSCYQDNRGMIWMGHEVGMTVWDTKTDSLYYFSQKEGGLCSNVVESILEGAQGKIWISTPTGISVVSRKENQRSTFSITNYQTSDDGELYCFNANAAAEKKDGNLAFGCIGGYVSVNPNTIVNQTGHPLKVMFSQISSNGEMLDETANEISLRHDNNNVVFCIYTNNITHASNSRFTYKLDGSFSHWVSTNDNRIVFASIPSGSYELRIKVQNRNGSWSQEKVLAIHVAYPFYLSKPMLLLYLLLIIAIIYGVWNYYRQKNLRKIAQMENEKELKMADMKLRFFANVSHDLRTPLTLIITPLQSLMKEPFPDNIMKKITLISKNSKILLEQINTLLDFRKLDVGAEKLTLNPGDIIDYMRRIYENFLPYALERKIQFTFDANPVKLYTEFDSDKIHKIMYNLLSNAFKFVQDQGVIHIKVNQVDQTLCVAISDTGKGIKDEDKARIFERFYKTDDYSQSTGSGIGLHIVREYIKLYKGKVFVTDNTPHGAIFHFQIPVLSTINNVSREEIYPEEDDRYTVLIVDDNRDLCGFLKDSLSEKYRVKIAYDGKEALEILNQIHVNLVISDIMMPIMNGLELCNRIKSDINLSHIPVILLTAKTAEKSVIEGLQMGADDYITKPFNLDLLILRIEKFINLNKQAHKEFIQKNDIKPSEITITPLDEKFMTKAIQIIEEHILDSDFSVEVLGQELGMTRVTLWRKLQSITGKGPGDFIKVIRLKKGKQLLDTTDMQITEVAYEIGYNTVKRFTENFKSEFGLTPSEYRQHK